MQTDHASMVLHLQEIKIFLQMYQYNILQCNNNSCLHILPTVYANYRRHRLVMNYYYTCGCRPSLDVVFPHLPRNLETTENQIQEEYAGFQIWYRRTKKH